MVKGKLVYTNCGSARPKGYLKIIRKYFRNIEVKILLLIIFKGDRRSLIHKVLEMF